MAWRIQAQARRDERPRSSPSPAGDSRRRSWPGWLILVPILVAGTVLVERWTRPVDQPDAEAPATPADPQPVAPAVLPEASAAAVTTEQLVAEGQQLVEHLAAAFPDDPEALAVGGQLLFALGNSSQAVAWWEQSLQANPQLGEAWCGLAVARWERGDFESAVTCMQRLVETDQKLADQRIYVLVDSLLNLGREQEAIEALESRTEVSSLSAPGRLVLGQAYLQAEKYEQARVQFEAALAAAPELANAHHGLAMALVGLGQTALAQQHRETYARLKRQEMETLDRQRGVGREIEKANPAELRAVLGRFCVRAGRLYADRGRWEDAQRHGLLAMNQNPSDAEARRLLERVASQAGHGEN